MNKVILLGRLTRDPESRTFSNGGKVTNLGFAVTGRRKTNDKGEWENEPAFIDLACYNRQNGRQLADVAERLVKGSQVLVEGRLVMDTWDQNGQKRSKLKIEVDSLTFTAQTAFADDGDKPPPRQQQKPAAAGRPARDYPPDDPPGPPEEDIPF